MTDKNSLNVPEGFEAKNVNIPDTDYESATKIDHENLDVEWVQQAETARYWGKHVAKLRSQVRRLEQKKKTIEAELNEKINNHPESYTNKAKPNADDVKAAIHRQKEHQDVIIELLDKRDELEYAEIAYQEIAYTKKKSLEELVELYREQYFAGPKEARNLQNEVKKREQNRKQANRAISQNAKMNRRKNNG